MPNRYRRVKWNNIGTGAKVRIRRSIWLAELQDFGTITDGAEDLPTSGATHRGNLGAKSGTREYVDLSTVNDLTVVDTQDHGAISDTAITAVAWKLNPENTNVVVPATQADFTIESSSPLMGWNYGSGNPNNNKTTYGATSKITDLLTNVASGTTQPVDSEYEVIASATGGSGGTPVISWHRINNPSATSSTTYRVYSYQAMGRAYSSTNQTGQQVIHAWDIEVPGNGALFVRPGQNGAGGRWGNGVNENIGPSGSYQHGVTGGTGGVSQIMIYDPSVSTGTTIDGVATNSILAITSSGSGTSGGNGTTTSTISASTGFMPYYSTAGTVNIIVQGRVNPFVARVAALGGYPNGSGSTSLPRSDNGYTSTYVTPVNDWDGTEIGLGSGSVAGTNYYLGDRSSATYQASQNGKFVFVSGAVKDS